MAFQDRLAALRKENGLSQEQLAEKINVSRQAISKWETGDTQPEMAKLLLLSDVLNTSLDDLCQSQPRQTAKSHEPALRAHRALWFVGVMMLAIGLALGGVSGHFLFRSTPAVPAKETAQPLDQLRISSLTVNITEVGSSTETLWLTFSPTISKEDWGYTVVKTTADGTTDPYGAEYKSGVCQCGIPALYGADFTLTAVVSDGTNSYSAGLLNVFGVSKASVSYDELWKNGSDGK